MNGPDNCEHVPVDRFMTHRYLGDGRCQGALLPTIEVDNRPDWDYGFRFDGGDCDAEVAPPEPDRACWPPAGSRWKHGEHVGEIEWSPDKRRWRMCALTGGGGYFVGWTDAAIDIAGWHLCEAP